MDWTGKPKNDKQKNKKTECTNQLTEQTAKQLAAKISASATSTYRIEEAVYETAQQRIEALAAKQQHAPEVDPQQDKIPIIRLKDEKGHFIPDACLSFLSFWRRLSCLSYLIILTQMNFDLGFNVLIVLVTPLKPLYLESWTIFLLLVMMVKCLC